LEELVELYGKSLMMFINSFVNDMYDAEELMIEVFARLITSNSRFQGRSSLKTYLFAIGRSLALRHLQKRKKENHLSLSNFEAEKRDYYLPEMNLLNKERSRQLYEAMDELKADHRQVLYLLYFEEISYADAAKVLKKTEKQIAGLAYRAKALLKNKLEKEGFDYGE